MPLIQSSSKEDLSKNISEMLASSKTGTGKFGKARKKFGAAKTRQMAIAAAFAVKDKNRGK